MTHRPNFVLVLLDDLSVHELKNVPGVERVMGEGVEFANAFVTNTVCCPSRATYFTGLYPRNHGVLTNVPEGPGGAYPAFRAAGMDERTIAKALHDGGYRNALFGKYQNGYEFEHGIPPGWDEWLANVGSWAWNLSPVYNDNGTLVDTSPENHLGLLARRSREFVERCEGPFFCVVAPYAPKIGDPLPEHVGVSRHAMPRPASFDEARGKPAYVQDLSRITTGAEAYMEAMYRTRVERMYGVVDILEGIVDVLEANRTLDNTYLFFTSDHGFHFGEHRLQVCKRTPYEETIRVPLYVRGPGVPKEGRAHMVLNNDFAPTVAELAGVEMPGVDGTSYAQCLRPSDSEGFVRADGWRKRFLVESWPYSHYPEPPRYKALRTRRYLYAENEGQGRELYDLAADPRQLDGKTLLSENPNLAAWMAGAVSSFGGGREAEF